MHRGIFSYTSCFEKEGTYFTITNMMGIIVVTLYKKNQEEQWVNTKIDIGKGNIKSNNQKVHSVVGNELQYIAEQIEKQVRKLDYKQKDIIIKKTTSIGKNIKKYDIFNDMLDDMNLNDNR